MRSHGTQQTVRARHPSHVAYVGYRSEFKVFGVKFGLARPRGSPDPFLNLESIVFWVFGASHDPFQNLDTVVFCVFGPAKIHSLEVGINRVLGLSDQPGSIPKFGINRVLGL